MLLLGRVESKHKHYYVFAGQKVPHMAYVYYSNRLTDQNNEMAVKNFDYDR